MPLNPFKIEELIADTENEAGLHEVFAALHESHRKKQHQRAKACQPDTVTEIHPDDLARIKAEAFRPLTEADRSMEGNEYLCRTVVDCLVAGDLGDIIHSLIRVWRKQWAWQPHLPPIEEMERLLANASQQRGED